MHEFVCMEKLYIIFEGEMLCFRKGEKVKYRLMIVFILVLKRKQEISQLAKG